MTIRKEISRTFFTEISSDRLEKLLEIQTIGKEISRTFFSTEISSERLERLQSTGKTSRDSND